MVETLTLLLIGFVAVCSSLLFVWAMASTSKKHDEESVIDRLLGR